MRWVDAGGDVGYEVRIDGLEETSGVCEVAAFSIPSISCVALVANELRYEWEIITGVYPDTKWRVY